MKKLILIIGLIFCILGGSAQEYYFKDDAGNHFSELDFAALGINIKDVDGNNRNSINTVFGDKIIGVRQTIIAAQFQYGIEDGASDIKIENGATIVIENSLLKMRTGTNTAGRARMESTETIRYIPGQEVFYFVTAVFDTAVVDSYQRLGLYDSLNGFYFGYEEKQFSFSRRRAGVDYHNSIDLRAFNALHGYTLIPTLGNVYKISYGYLGFAPISLEIMKPNGDWVLLHKIEYPNSETVTHTTQTFLPVRGEVANTGNNTNLEIRAGSVAAGIVDGGGGNISDREFTWANDATFVITDSVTLITFRNKEIFNGVENRVLARLLFVSGANSANKTLRWRLYKNPTLEVSPIPVWVDVSANNSTLEYSLNAIVDYDLSSDLFLAWNTGKEAYFIEHIEDMLLDLPPGGIASFVILSSANAGEGELSIRWSELF